MKMDTEKRNEDIYNLRLEGKSFTAIGEMYNISKGRARQIFHRVMDKKILRKEVELNTQTWVAFDKTKEMEFKVYAR